jgi:hypothetical protein
LAGLPVGGVWQRRNLPATVPCRLELGTPSALFSAAVVPGIDGLPSFDYVVTRDGQRFLIETAVRSDVVPLTAVINWTTPAAPPRQ